MDEHIIKFIDSVAALSPQNIPEGFCEGWATPLSPKDHYEVLCRASHCVVAVVDGSMIGFVTAISDGILTAYIPLLEVLPQHRGRGIGSELVQRIVAKLGRIYMIDVLCDDDVTTFYERLGFTRVSGACIRNHDWRLAN